MRAILLCAGFGTRLRPLTDGTPKALVEVAGRPIVDYLMAQLVAWDELEAIHVVHNDRHPEAFARWQARWNARLARAPVRLHNDGVRSEGERLGAVGDLRFVLARVGTEAPAVVAASDSLYRVALRPIVDRFRAASAHCVLALPQTDERALRHSSVFALEGDRVRGVVHAPADPPSRWVSPAFYAFRSSGLAHVARYLECGGDPDTLGRFVDDLARRERVEAVKLRGAGEGPPRYHVNTPDEHARASAALARRGVGEAGR